MGELKSLRQNEIHLDELKNDENYQVPANAKLVDDQTSSDDAKKYRLVMVGRKVSADEAHTDKSLSEILTDADQ